jgi:hypothetical protein
LCMHFPYPHACYMLFRSQPPWFYEFKNICWSLKVMKLFISRSFPASRQFLPLRSIIQIPTEIAYAFTIKCN